MSNTLAPIQSQAMAVKTAASAGTGQVAGATQLTGTGQSQGKDVLLFARVLEENNKMAQELMKTMGPAQEGLPQMQSVSGDSIKLSTEDLSKDAENQIQSKNKVGEILGEVNRGQLQMEGIMEIAMSGRHFSPSELLAMQAGVYQIAQEMELTSKVFEQVNNAHKTLWNTNFQG